MTHHDHHSGHCCSRTEESCCQGDSHHSHEKNCGCHDCKEGEVRGNTNSQNSLDLDSIPDVPLPPPTLLTVATTIATQAMVAMGYIPSPLSGKPHFMLNQGKHLIDTVQLLFDKTKGNRTEEETKTLESVIHELQMLFVAATHEKERRDAEKK